MKATADLTFYTVTMAKIQAEQGNLARAALIYHHLLRRSPERDDLAEALADIEILLANKDPYDLVALVSRWAELMLTVGRLANLSKIRSQLCKRNTISATKRGS